MAKGKTKKNNSDGKNDEEAAGVPSAAIDGNTGKENDPVKKNGDELCGKENDVANGDSNRGKEKDLSQTENPQQRVTRIQSTKAASQQQKSPDEADKDGKANGDSNRGKEKDLSQTENPQQRVTRSQSTKAASQQQKSPDEADKDGKANGESDRDKEKDPKLAVIPVIIAFFIIIVAILLHDKGFSSPPDSPPHLFDFPKIFANKIMELQSSFTNQTDRFWRIIKNRGLAHLRNASPPQPLVLLLAAPPAAHSTVECFAKKLAEALDPKHKGRLATIDGREERNYPGEETKKKMDDLLIRSFKKGHRAALVHHLELLPPPSPLLFYSYCDEKNAPYKHVAIIFTVHLPVEPDASLAPREAEGKVDKYLAEEVWAKEDKDAVADLLIRVADTVALMNGEPSSLDTC